MGYTLFDINDDYNRPKFWLARPNKQIITRMKELDNIVQLKLTLGGIFELSGELPMVLFRNNATIDNPHKKHFKNKYLLKMQFMGKTEWYVIELTSLNSSEEKDYIPFTAYNMAYNLRGKKLYNDTYEGKTIREVVDDLLLATAWSVGKVSTEIGGKIRTFDEFSVNTNVLEALNTVAESYDCIPEFDSDTKLINFLHKNDYNAVSNLMINDKNYIRSMERSLETTEITTRLFPTGDEEISINSVAPTGKSYIDRYDWFMHPFKRDSDGKTIESSDYMSDELCHAILNQQEKITEITPLVESKLDLINESLDSLIPLQDTIDDKRLAYEVCEGVLDIMRGNQEYEYSDFSSNSSYTFNYRKGWYALQFRSVDGTGTITIDKNNYLATTDWTTIKLNKSTLDPLGEGEKNTIKLLTGNLEFMCVRIPETEYKTFTDQQVTDKYNIMQKKLELDMSTLEYTNKKTYIDNIQEEVNILQTSASDDVFFTFELLEERSEFIYEYYWNESTHTKPQELYDDSIEKMKELHKPVTNISTDIYNFLDSLDDKRNWKKIILGSKVLLKHSRLGTYDEVMLTEINYDFAGGSINLVLSDVRDLNQDELKQLIMQGANASSTLNLNKHLYDDAVKQSATFDEILNSEWDAVKNAIVAGVNETVKLSNRGLEIRSPDKPSDMLIGTSGVLAISNDGGQTFKNAITKDGIVAERIVGKLIIGNKVIIRDDDGTMLLNGSLQTIKDRNGVVKVLNGEYEPNKFGMQIYDGAFEFRTHSKTATNGMVLNSNGIVTKDSAGKVTFELDSTTGNVKMSSGIISWDDVNAPTAGQVGARPSNWYPSESDVVGSKLTKITSNGVYTGTIEANQIYAGTITGFTIIGGSFETYDNSSSGKITITGSTLLSTKYGTSGKEYTKMANGILEIKSLSESVGSYQTVSINGNYGINISSDINSNSGLRMDVYETQSMNDLMTYRISAVTETYKETNLIISSTSSLELKSQAIQISGSLYAKGATFSAAVEGTSAKFTSVYDAGNRVATQTWSNDKFWATGSSSGYLSQNVYIGPTSIGVGGVFNGSASTTSMSLGSNNIYAPGKVYASGVALTSSRERKKNIETFSESVLPIISEMRPVTYQLKTDKDFELHRLGFILEELGLAELIDPDGGVDQYALITMAIKGVQELNEKIKILETTI